MIKNRVLKEITIYAVMVAGLAILLHPDLISSPAERLAVMQERGNFAHPLLYSLIIYLLIAALRFLVWWVKKLLTKGSDQAK